MDELTEFEQLLKQYFPEIYELNQYGKEEAFLWHVINTIKASAQTKLTGRIEITFNQGMINEVNRTEKTLYGVKKR